MSEGRVTIREKGGVSVQELVAEITKKFDRSYWMRCAREDRFIDEMWEVMGRAGLLGIGVPEEYGGSGGGVTEDMEFIEALAAAGSPSLQLLLNDFVRQALLRHGTEEQKLGYVRPSAKGELKLGFAITEPNAGTNTFEMETTASRKDDGSYVLNGEKIYISVPRSSGYLMVVARTRPFEDLASRREGLSLFMVDPEHPGVELHKLNVAVPMPERQYRITFKDVEVPARDLVGEEDRGIEVIFDALNPERLAVAAISIGIGEYALSRAASYARQRAPFGEPIGSYQAVQHPLAYAKAHLTAARLVLYEGARAYDAGKESGPLANTAKLLGSEAGARACDAAIQTHGGYGFDSDYEVIDLWPMARLLKVAPLNNEMILNYLAERTLGLPRSY